MKLRMWNSLINILLQLLLPLLLLWKIVKQLNHLSNCNYAMTEKWERGLYVWVCVCVCVCVCVKERGEIGEKVVSKTRFL